MFYNEHSQVVRKLQANKENHILDTAILYIAYSKTEKRVIFFLEFSDWCVSVGLHFGVLGHIRQLQVREDFLHGPGRAPDLYKVHRVLWIVDYLRLKKHPFCVGHRERVLY